MNEGLPKSKVITHNSNTVSGPCPPRGHYTEAVGDPFELDADDEYFDGDPNDGDPTLFGDDPDDGFDPDFEDECDDDDSDDYPEDGEDVW